MHFPPAAGSRFAWLLAPVFVLLLALAAATTGCGTNPEAEARLRVELRRQVRAPFRWFRRPTVDADDVQPIVRRFYARRNYAPAWTDARGPHQDAKNLIAALHEAPRDGLDPKVYQVDRIDSLVQAIDAGPLEPTPAARRVARLDVLLTRAFLTYGAHLSTGRVNPRAIPADWHLRPPRVDLDSMLTVALDRHRVRETLVDLAPQDPRYARLRDALEQYREIGRAGGWPQVPKGKPLKIGARDPRVAVIRARLAATGDLPRGAVASTTFDAGVRAGVQRFQVRHGLKPDGVVGPAEITAMNVPVTRRIGQIELNMERWRWVRPLGDRYLMVNIPDFTLQIFEGGRPTLGMRVVVGKSMSPTPIFSDEITYLVINPYWNVPAKIAGTELVDEMKKNPSYLADNQIRVFEKGNTEREVDAASIDWNGLDPANVPYTFRQDPGPDNAVGHVKFMCPNQFDVYLHDTPADHLFNAEERDFSHGCIRVEAPVQLAAYLLRGRSNASDIEAAFASSATDSSVKLEQPMPVDILYWTAWVDDHGIVNFRDDVYGMDGLLDRAVDSAVPLASSAGEDAEASQGRFASVARLEAPPAALPKRAIGPLKHRAA